MAVENFDYFEALEQISNGCVIKLTRYEDEIIDTESEDGDEKEEDRDEEKERGEEEEEEDSSDSVDSENSISAQQLKRERIRTSLFVRSNDELEKHKAILNRCRDEFSRLEPQRPNQIRRSRGRLSTSSSASLRRLLRTQMAQPFVQPQKISGHVPKNVSNLNCRVPDPYQSFESDPSNQMVRNLKIKEEPNSFTQDIFLNMPELTNKCRESTYSENISDKSSCLNPNTLDRSGSPSNDVSLLIKELPELAHSNSVGCNKPENILRNSAQIVLVEQAGSSAPKLRVLKKSIAPAVTPSNKSSSSANVFCTPNSSEDLFRKPSQVAHKESTSITQELVSTKKSDTTSNVYYDVPKKGSFNSDGMIIQWKVASESNICKISFKKLSDMLECQSCGDIKLDQMMSKNCSYLLSSSSPSSIKNSTMWHRPFRIPVNKTIPTPSANPLTNSEAAEENEVPQIAPLLDYAVEELQNNQFEPCANNNQMNNSSGTISHSSDPQMEVLRHTEALRIPVIKSPIVSTSETKSPYQANGICREVPVSINQDVPVNARCLTQENDKLTMRIPVTLPQVTPAIVPVCSTNGNQEEICANVGQSKALVRTNSSKHTSQILYCGLKTTLQPSMVASKAEQVLSTDVPRRVPQNENEEPSMVASTAKQVLTVDVPGGASLNKNETEVKKNQSNISQYSQELFIYHCVIKLISFFDLDTSSQSETINVLKSQIADRCKHEFHVEGFLINMVQKTLENCPDNSIRYLKNLVSRIIDEKIQKKYKITNWPQQIEKIFQEYETPRTQEAQITSSKSIQRKRKATTKGSGFEQLKKSNRKQCNTQRHNTQQSTIQQSIIQQSMSSTVIPSVPLPQYSAPTSGDYIHSYPRYADPKQLPWQYQQNQVSNTTGSPWVPPYNFHNMPTESYQECSQCISTVNQLPKQPYDAQQVPSTQLMPLLSQQQPKSSIQGMQQFLPQNLRSQRQSTPQQFQLQHRVHQDQSQWNYHEKPLQPFLTTSQQLSQRSEVSAISMRSQNSRPAPLVLNREVSRMDYSPPAANTAPPSLSSHLYSMVATVSQNSNSNNHQVFVGMATYQQSATNLPYERTNGETFRRSDSYQNSYLPAGPANLEQNCNYYQNVLNTEQFPNNSFHDEQQGRVLSKQNSLLQPSSNCLDNTAMREMLERYLGYTYDSDIPDVLSNSPNESNIMNSTYNFP